MLCPRCNTYVTAEELVCPNCGMPADRSLKEEGIRAIRQGKQARENPYVPPERSIPRRSYSGASRVYVGEGRTDRGENEIPVYGETGRFLKNEVVDENYQRHLSYGNRQREGRKYQGNDPKGKRRNHELSKHVLNWAHAAIVMGILLVLMAVGTYLFLNKTNAGQRVMARWGFSATAQALWQVGEECLDKGDVKQAITNFETARELDGQESINVEGLLLLGSAYEADGRLAEAEALYTLMYTDIVPTRSEPYRNVIRMMLADGRRPQAAELMQVAYDKTKLDTFREQRRDLLPQTPKLVDEQRMTAGYYKMEKDIELYSPEGFEIWYTTSDEAVLPQDGVLYTGPIHLEEAVYNLRAVAVNGDLVSDPWTGTYKIILPSPKTPYPSLAPNTYEKRQRVRLKPGELDKTTATAEEIADYENNAITIYYTIDGSTPDYDSPIYDYVANEGIVLPTGRVTLKAIAMNSRGKVSNVLEVGYKIMAKPWPLDGYKAEDTIGRMTLNITTRDEFEQKHGTGEKVEACTHALYEEAEKVSYSWGYAVMGKKKNGWVLAELSFQSTQFAGPRGTAIGDTEVEITKKFRDLGQVASPSGNRGLYCDGSDVGKIFMQPDGSKIIRYTCATGDSHVWQLEYIINQQGICTGINWLLVS